MDEGHLCQTPSQLALWVSQVVLIERIRSATDTIYDDTDARRRGQSNAVMRLASTSGSADTLRTIVTQVNLERIASRAVILYALASTDFTVVHFFVGM